MAINTSVHTAMYWYYAYNEFTGHKFWWARYLTQLQMGQFVFNGSAMCVWIVLDQIYGCSGDYVGVALCMFGMVTYLWLFARMYQKKYEKTK
jgi:hypothetical protein